MSTDLNEFGFDPKTILSPAPPKKDPSKKIKDTNFDTLKKFNICEMTGCCKKATGHFGSINLCWDHGKHIEHNWKNQFGTHWTYVYWKYQKK
jgi:hypothetical protein